MHPFHVETNPSEGVVNCSQRYIEKPAVLKLSSILIQKCCWLVLGKSQEILRVLDCQLAWSTMANCLLLFNTASELFPSLCTIESGFGNLAKVKNFIDRAGFPFYTQRDLLEIVTDLLVGHSGWEIIWLRDALAEW